MHNGLDLATVRDFGTALLIGALVGTEREKRKSAEAEAGIGGLRTFVLMALLGAIAGWFANALHMPALLIATFIVLPLLPSRAVDPWGALNPYSLWLLVLLISSLSLVGYVGTRWLGADRGIVLTGLTGGLVSSTAVTLSFARQSREDSRRTTAYALASGVLLAWCIMFGRVIAEVLVVNRALLVRVLIPFAMMGATAAI